jgi:hypothetical protein
MMDINKKESIASKKSEVQPLPTAPCIVVGQVGAVVVVINAPHPSLSLNPKNVKYSRQLEQWLCVNAPPSSSNSIQLG